MFKQTYCDINKSNLASQSMIPIKHNTFDVRFLRINMTNHSECQLIEPKGEREKLEHTPSSAKEYSTWTSLSNKMLSATRRENRENE